MVHKDPRNLYHWDPKQWDEWGLDLPQWSHIKTGLQSGKGRRVMFDIEADGLLEASGEKTKATRFWCIAAMDYDTGEEFYWGWDQELPGEEEFVAVRPETRRAGWLNAALEFLGECDMLVAHNGIGFDYPVSERLYGWTRPARSWDSLPIAKAVWPYESLIGPDMQRIRAGTMPGQFLKRHSLEAWGYRTGTRKGDYEGGFHEWCPAMATYLMGDVRGLAALWRLIERRIGWAPDSPPGTLRWSEETIEDECFIQRLIFEQEHHGARFDLTMARALAADLKNRQAALEQDLAAAFGSWWQAGEVTTPARAVAAKMQAFPDTTMRRVSAATGKELKPYVGPPLCYFSPDAPYTPIERIDYNPSSRKHLGMRLQDLYGWKPKEFGKNGDPKVSETVLEAIPEGVMPASLRKMIMDYFVVAKTLGTLAQGQKAWIRMAEGPTNRHPWHVEGFIHGTMDTCGAVTRRGTHKDPNLSGTPAVILAKGPDGVEHPVLGLEGKFGWECRSMFTAREGYERTGVDASSLELIDLGHYLTPFDGGKFSERVCDPKRDAHQEHAVICMVSRKDAKTTIYLFIYGGSAYKLSLDPAIIVTADAVPELLTYRGLPMLLKSLSERLGPEFVDKLDDMQRARIAHCRQVIIKLEGGIEGLKDLKKSVTEAAKRGWLKAIDGSRIIVRKDYAALNALLQSAGAISCKRWIRLFHQEMARRGYVLWRDYFQVLWVHDEMQLDHLPGMSEEIKEVAEWAMRLAGEQLGLKGTYRTAGKTGSNWAECH